MVEYKGYKIFAEVGPTPREWHFSFFLKNWNSDKDGDVMIYSQVVSSFPEENESAALRAACKYIDKLNILP